MGRWAAVATPDAQRQVLSIARLMRFASDWQAAHSRESLADFVAYLDLYQEVGGDLETDIAASAQVEGVQLMTIYQAKGLEYEVVIVPRLIEGQFPDVRPETQLIPIELLKQAPPPAFEVDEERRLCFVAMTRAKQRLVLTTIDAPESSRNRPSRFVDEVIADDVVVTRRDVVVDAEVEGSALSAEDAAVATTAVLQRLMPVPQAFERRYALRRRAVEIIGALEALAAGDSVGRSTLLAELVTVATDAAGQAEEARRNGLDPVTLRVLSKHAPAGEALLQIAPIGGFSHSAFQTYLTCPLKFAFQRVYRIPDDETKSYFEFGTAVHKAGSRPTHCAVRSTPLSTNTSSWACSS